MHIDVQFGFDGYYYKNDGYLILPSFYNQKRNAANAHGRAITRNRKIRSITAILCAGTKPVPKLVFKTDFMINPS